MNGILGLTFCLFLSGILNALANENSVEVYPGPPGIQSSPQYTTTIIQDGISYSSFVYQNQNPAFLLDGSRSTIVNAASTQEKSTAWTSFSFSGSPVTVQITNSKVFTAARVLPSWRKLKVTISENGTQASFPMPDTVQVAVDFCYASDGCATDLEWDTSNPMLVFANPPQPLAQTSDIQAVSGSNSPPAPLTSTQTGIHFAPGVYNLGSTPFLLGTGQEAVLDGGAYVNGFFAIKPGASGITVRGRGILSGEKTIQSTCHPPGSLTAFCPNEISAPAGTSHLTIDGITIIDSPNIAIEDFGTQNSVVNVKEITWLGNEGGIQIGGPGSLSQPDTGSSIRASFFKVGDDNFILGSSNLLIEGCTVWHLSNASVFEIGVNGHSAVSNVQVLNTDVVRAETASVGRTNAIFAAQLAGDSSRTGFEFNNIHIENSDFQLFQMAISPSIWSTPGDNSLGSISGFSFKNIDVADTQKLPSLFQSYDLVHQISDITFDKLTVNGLAVNSPSITFNANRIPSLPGTTFSGLLWRSSSQPKNFQVSVFSGAGLSNNPTTLALNSAAIPPGALVPALGDF
jgi:hypothetical protein